MCLASKPPARGQYPQSVEIDIAEAGAVVAGVVVASCLFHCNGQSQVADPQDSSCVSKRAKTGDGEGRMHERPRMQRLSLVLQRKHQQLMTVLFYP
jgi:hypothetical protein